MHVLKQMGVVDISGMGRECPGTSAGAGERMWWGGRCLLVVFLLSNGQVVLHA